MFPLVIRDKNVMLGKDQPEYRPLAVRREEYDDHVELVSLWEPTAKELRILNQGGAVKLAVFGNTHPPVKLSVQAPPSVRDI